METKQRERHGTRSKYVMDKCRCDECREATRVYEAGRRRLKMYGQWQPYVPAEPARVHVRTLMDSGVGWKRVAELAGVPRSTVMQLLYGKRGKPVERIRAHTVEALLSVTPGIEKLSSTAAVDSTGTRRRLQALVTLGWSVSELGRRLGRLPGNFWRAIDGETVSAGLALAVEEMYDELWDAPPAEIDRVSRYTAARARNFARKKRWAPPMAWDDDTIDDPAASPGQYGRSREGRRATAEDLEWLIDQGIQCREELAANFGMDRASLERQLHRIGLIGRTWRESERPVAG